MELRVNGTPAVKIYARFLRESSSGAAEQYSCEDDDVWFPKASVSYNREEETLLVEKRLYDQKVAQGEL